MFKTIKDIEPNGCELCGQAKNFHGMTSANKTKMHYYTEPCDATRLERMKLRRNLRSS